MISGKGWGNSTGDWKPRPYKQGDEAEIARLAATVYPKIDKDSFLATWRVKYARSPEGFVSWVADADGKVVGHYGALITSATLAGKSILVAQAVDAFTHPEWRSRGIFVGLGKALLDDLGGKGVHLAYGIPNKSAMPGHRHLSWAVVVKVPRMIAMMDRGKAISAYRGGRLKKIALRITSSLHPRAKPGGDLPALSIGRPPSALRGVEDIWMTTRGEFGFVLERNAAYLAWRYDTESPRNYAVITKETDVGSVAAAVCGIGSGGVGQLTELLCRSGHEEDAVQVLQRTIQHLMEKGCHTVETLASTRETMRVLKSAGFFKVSKVLLIAHANDPKGADELRTLLGAERIMLSFGDSDLA